MPTQEMIDIFCQYIAEEIYAEEQMQGGESKRISKILKKV